MLPVKPPRDTILPLNFLQVPKEPSTALQDKIYIPPQEPLTLPPGKVSIFKEAPCLEPFDNPLLPKAFQTTRMIVQKIIEDQTTSQAEKIQALREVSCHLFPENKEALSMNIHYFLLLVLFSSRDPDPSDIASVLLHTLEIEISQRSLAAHKPSYVKNFKTDGLRDLSYIEAKEAFPSSKHVHVFCAAGQQEFQTMCRDVPTISSLLPKVSAVIQGLPPPLTPALDKTKLQPFPRECKLFVYDKKTALHSSTLAAEIACEMSPFDSPLLLTSAVPIESLADHGLLKTASGNLFCSPSILNLLPPDTTKITRFPIDHPDLQQELHRVYYSSDKVLSEKDLALYLPRRRERLLQSLGAWKCAAAKSINL